MRIDMLWGPLAAGLLLVLPALGDTVQGTRSAALYERKHEVRVTLHPGWAELRVRRTVENLGPRHDQALFWIDVPPGAVAVGLRTLGSAAGRPRWFSGELMEAESAAAKYRELTGIGGYYPKDPALLSWRSAAELALQVFPVTPGDKKTVEYTFLAPTRYERGAHRYTLPAPGTADLTAEISWAPVARGERLLVQGKPASAGGRTTPKLDQIVELGLVPPSSDPLGGELALAVASKTKIFTHLSVRAAPRVSRVPKDAYLVVVLDGSRSLSTGDLEGQQTAARAYLRHFKDAQVEVVTFDRTVHPRYGRFVPVERARRDLGALGIAQKNGSAVDEALAGAEKLLAAAPTGHARRILLLSDARTRQSLKPERLRAVVGSSSATVHLVEFRAGPAELHRDDNHPWAEAARATGGLAWNASAARHAGKKDLAIFEEWARPLRVEHLKLYSPDIELFGSGEEPAPEVLDEGEAFTRSLWGGRAVKWVRVEGELWSKHIEQIVHPDAEAGKRWSALIFGDETASAELSEAEMMTLAMRGGAVSPVTSYLAIEPGVRPSTEGLEHGQGFGHGHGLAPSIRMGATATGGAVAQIDQQAWLERALRPTWLACGGKPDSVTVGFETTLAEVVDVGAVEIRSGHDAVLERCLSEAVWDLVLPPQFVAEWAPWSVSL